MLQPLLDYFITTYVYGDIIPNTNPQQRYPSMFAPQMWNQYQNTLNGRHRTNNICEGWNNSLNILVGGRNPTFYKSLDAIQKDYAAVNRDLLRSQASTPLTQVVRHEVRTYNNN